MNFNRSLPPEVERLEKTMGQFSAEFAQRLSENLKLVAFTGPASFREPEIDDCWHPCFIRRGFLYFLFQQIIPLARAFFGGIKRFILGRFGKFIFLQKNSSSILGVTPLSICTIVDNNIKTNYCYPEDAANLNWLVINDAGKEVYEVSKLKIYFTCLFLLLTWFRISFFDKKSKNVNWLTASVITLRWILNLQWVTLWMLDKRLQQILKQNKITKVFCVHEMWPWARVVWRTAYRNNVPTITFQHALIARTKLWYFPAKEELASGLRTPNEFFIFSNKEQELLKEFYPPETVFHFGCGPRFAHWKTKILPQSFDKLPIAPVLFVSSIPWWDNEVIFRGAEKLLNLSENNRPIKFRLHPLVKLIWKQKRRLQSMVKQGKMNISSCSLSDDLKQAAIVIGMNSTVLEEGLIMGLPVIVLKTDEFLSFATHLGKHITLKEFNWEKIRECFIDKKNNKQKQIEDGKEALGIERPIFRVNI
ncbi:MAG: hypothetical protein Q8M83_01620 [bacterium]|nr:hypothetical protein [bacterium]